MTVTINGTTGIDKVQDGTIQSADFAAGVPARSNLPAGTVLQVVQAFDTQQLAIGVVGWTDYISLNITPTSSSSKILVHININYASDSNNTSRFFRVTRNGTVVGAGTAANGNEPTSIGDGPALGFTSSGNMLLNGSSMYLDSPASASVVSYKLQYSNGIGTMYINRCNGIGNTFYAATPCSITLLEVAA